MSLEPIGPVETFFAVYACRRSAGVGSSHTDRSKATPCRARPLRSPTRFLLQAHPSARERRRRRMIGFLRAGILTTLTPALIADGEQLFAILGSYPVIALPPSGIIFPVIRRTQRRSWAVRTMQKRKPEADDRRLHVAVPWVSTRVAKRKVGEQETWHAAVFDDVFCRTDNNCRNAVFLKMPGDQTHGLVTDRSKSCK